MSHRHAQQANRIWTTLHLSEEVCIKLTEDINFEDIQYILML